VTTCKQCTCNIQATFMRHNFILILARQYVWLYGLTNERTNEQTGECMISFVNLRENSILVCFTNALHNLFFLTLRGVRFMDNRQMFAKFHILRLLRMHWDLPRHFELSLKCRSHWSVSHSDIVQLNISLIKLFLHLNCLSWVKSSQVIFILRHITNMRNIQLYKTHIETQAL